jgi:CHAT domain-containing protein
VQLVTLSACDTERGKLVRGEGAQGFNRAFLAAGADSSVASLWRVADRPAAEFMKHFYYELSRGRAKSEALRTAKLAFLRSHSKLAHPRYWAAFVLSGDGRSPIAPVIPWGVLLGSAGVVVCIVAVLFRRRRVK